MRRQPGWGTAFVEVVIGVCSGWVLVSVKYPVDKQWSGRSCTWDNILVGDFLHGPLVILIHDIVLRLLRSRFPSRAHGWYPARCGTFRLQGEQNGADPVLGRLREWFPFLADRALRDMSHSR